MRGLKALGALALVLLCLPGAALGTADKGEKEIFPAGPEPTQPPESSRPTTIYWKVSVELRVGPSEPGAWFRLTLPLSDGRQTILSRQVAEEGFETRESGDKLNFFGSWTRQTGSGESTAEIDLLAAVSDLRVEPSTAAFPLPVPDAEMVPFLTPSPLIQSDDPEIRRRARQLVRSAKRLDEAAWAVFQYTASFLKSDPDPQTTDARSVLRNRKGSGAGKSRLLVAFLRSLGIPARMVGGLRLVDASKVRGTTSWVEAYLGDRWFPMDPGNDYFGFLPANILTLYHGDLPLIVHRAGLALQYEFLVRQVTRKSIYETGETGGRSILKSRKSSESSDQSDRVRTVASYMDKPVATVVVLTDEEVPQAVVDRMRAEAKDNEINLVLLIARFQSRYFRESVLQRLAANNMNAIRDAHVLLVSTRDEAGLYSLLALGDGKLRLDDARIVITGSFWRPVGEVLGGVLYALFDPGELAIFPRRADLLSLWEVARTNLIYGLPIIEESRKWGIEPSMVDDARIESLSLYRRRVIGAWAKAVRAQVPLQALNLILVLPVIAFLVVICRNFIGLDTFGTFSPVLVSLAFLTTGLAWGTVIFVVIVGLGAALRAALQKLRLHLVARLAILIGLVSVVMTGLTVVGATLGIGALLQVSLFPMVIMSNLIENFTASQVEFGTREAIRLTLNTLLVCVISYAAVEWTGLPSLLLAFPEILVAVMILEVAAGKWRGLRLVELRRFYDLLRRSRGSR